MNHRTLGPSTPPFVTPQAVLAPACGQRFFFPPAEGNPFLSREGTHPYARHLAHGFRLALLATLLAAVAFHLPALAAPGGREDAARPFAASPAPQAMSEIRTLFAEYLKLHAAKDMDKWKDLFLPEATAVSSNPEGTVHVYHVAELARSIAEDAKKLQSQHEIFEDTRIEVYGNTALYATNWTLFHDGKAVRKGRAFFSLVKKDGAWRIASLVWHSD